MTLEGPPEHQNPVVVLSIAPLPPRFNSRPQPRPHSRRQAPPSAYKETRNSARLFGINPALLPQLRQCGSFPTFRPDASSLNDKERSKKIRQVLSSLFFFENLPVLNIRRTFSLGSHTGTAYSESGSFRIRLRRRAQMIAR
jgi:hypothetical protein